MESRAAVHMGREYALGERNGVPFLISSRWSRTILARWPDGAFGDERGEAFDLVVPGRVDRPEVNGPTRPVGEIGPDLGMLLVGGVFFDDEMSSWAGTLAST